MDLRERDDSRDIIASVVKDINSFSLDAVMRILESVIEGGSHKNIRMRSGIRLDVPWCELSDISTSGDTVSLYCNRFGVANMQSTLPNSYIEEFIMSKEEAIKEFLDIFNNKMLSLSYETSKKYNLAIQNSTASESSYSDILMALCGNLGGNKEEYANILKHALMMWRKPRFMLGLRTILGCFFKTDIAIRNFIGGWRKIAEESLTILGKKNVELGINTVLGDKVWDQKHSLELTMGPMDRDDFESFFRKDGLLRMLCFILDKYVNFGKKYVVKVILEKDAPSPAFLDGSNGLGINTWFYSRNKNYDTKMNIYQDRIDAIEKMLLNE